MSMTTHDPSSRHFQRKISEFCELRIAPVASRRVFENIRPYLASLIVYRKSPPLLNGHIDWTTIGQACGIEAELTAELKSSSGLLWMPSSDGSAHHRQPKSDGHQSQRLARPKSLTPRKRLPHPRPERRNARRPTAPLPGPRRHSAALNQNLSARSQTHYLKRLKIR